MLRLHRLALIASVMAAAHGCGRPAPAAVPSPQPAPAVFTTAGFPCPSPTQPGLLQSRRLNMLVRAGHLPPEIEECFGRIFGVEIRRQEYSSADRLIEILAQHPGAFDLVEVTDYLVIRLVAEGRLAKLDGARLPLMDNYFPDYLNFAFDPGNEYTVPFRAGTYGLIVNTRRVAVPPFAWADLWDGAYGGRMVFPEESRPVIGAVLLSLGHDVNSTRPPELEQARLKLQQLVLRIRVFDSDSPKTALIAGDIELGMTWTSEAQLAGAADPALEYIYPAEGAIIWQDNWAMLAHAGHADAAYAWLNYTMQGDVFWRFLRQAPSTAPNRAALEYMRANQRESYDLYLSSPITNTAVEVLAAGHRLMDVGEAASLYDRIWAEVTGLK